MKKRLFVVFSALILSTSLMAAVCAMTFDWEPPPPIPSPGAGLQGWTGEEGTECCQLYYIELGANRAEGYAGGICPLLRFTNPDGTYTVAGYNRILWKSENPYPGEPWYQWAFYEVHFQSPDLSEDAQWQNIDGVSIEFRCSQNWSYSYSPPAAWIGVALRTGGGYGTSYDIFHPEWDGTEECERNMGVFHKIGVAADPEAEFLFDEWSTLTVTDFDIPEGSTIHAVVVMLRGHWDDQTSEYARFKLDNVRPISAHEPGSFIWKKTSNPSTNKAYDVAVDGSGVYVVGNDLTGHDWKWRIEKRDKWDGSLIWAKTPDPSSGVDEVHGVAVDGTGVYIVGYDTRLGAERWRMEKRSLEDGSLIWAKTKNPSWGQEEAEDVAVDGTGVYIVGYEFVSLGDYRWRMEKRSTTDGSRIWKKTSNPSIGVDAARGVAVDSTGVYVVGHDHRPGDYNYRWRIEKRSLGDGSLIWKKFSNPSSGTDEATGVAVDGTGVYIVGYDAVHVNYRWRIEKRSLTDGSLIWTKTKNPSSGYDEAWDVAVDSTGVYIVGSEYVSGVDYKWRIEKRSTTDGSLIWKKNSNPSSDPDVARGVAVDGSGVYIVGYDNKLGNPRWRIEKRYP